MIQQQQAQLVAHLYIGASRQIAHANSPKADVRGFAQSERFSQTLIFDGERHPSTDVITLKLAPFRSRRFLGKSWHPVVAASLVGQRRISGFIFRFVVGLVAFLVTFFADRRSCDTRRRRFPNYAAPFVGFAEDL